MTPKLIHNHYVTSAKSDLSSGLVEIAIVMKTILSEIKSNFINEHTFTKDHKIFNFTGNKNTPESINQSLSEISTTFVTNWDLDELNILNTIQRNQSNFDLIIDTEELPVITESYIEIQQQYVPSLKYMTINKVESVISKCDIQSRYFHVAEDEKKYMHLSMTSTMDEDSTELIDKSYLKVYDLHASREKLKINKASQNILGKQKTVAKKKHESRHKKQEIYASHQIISNKKIPTTACSLNVKNIQKQCTSTHLRTIPGNNCIKQKMPTTTSLNSNKKMASSTRDITKMNEVYRRTARVAEFTTNHTTKNHQKPNTSKNQSKISLRKSNETHILSKQRSVTSKSLVDKNFSNSKLYSEIKNAFLCLKNTKQLQDILKLVHEAKISNKTFTVVGGYEALRKALMERGWLEKIWLPARNMNANNHLQNLSVISLALGMKHKDCGNDYRKALISKLLLDHQADYCWDMFMESDPYTRYPDKIKHTLINRYPVSATEALVFKSGLCDILKNNSHWFYIKDESSLLYPRTYNLALECETEEFVEDYRITSVISLFNYVLENSKYNKPIMSVEGTIDVSTFNFAFLHSQIFLRRKQHQDIDEDIAEINDHAWEIFLDNFYKLAHDAQHFKQSDRMSEKLLIHNASIMLQKFENFWPSIRAEGCMNLWILKPHKGWQGHGIILKRTLKSIMELNSKQKEKLIVQKYIEKPFLVYDTKFDIRQWFLFTNQPDLCIWMYRDCYLRFSSRLFSLNKLHESIHLTNYAVQKKYKPFGRNHNIPADNMWHCDTFKKYLLHFGHPQAWSNIQKKMKETMICVLMCCEDRLCHRINTFELFGMDFLLTENLQPVLLEINSMPAIQKSSAVTTKLGPKILHDIVKVTVDYASSHTASTGKFELIYRKEKEENKQVELIIEGINYFTKYKETEFENINKVHELCKKLMSTIETNCPTNLQYWQDHNSDFRMLEEDLFIGHRDNYN